MKVSTNVNIHNRFDIEVRDAITGEIKQKAYAENIVLNQMYDRLCARLTYFVNIHFGTGTGTLAASRTSLFTHLGTKAVTNDAQSKVLPTSYWRQKIVLAPEEYVGSALSEVGIAFGSTSTNLVTHALIRDMNGNVITLTKTSLDVVTIYATIYVTFSTSHANMAICSMNEQVNPLVNYLIGGTAFPALDFFTGKSPKSNGKNTRNTISNYIYKSGNLTLTTDVANKKFYTNTFRISIDNSNDHLTEVALGKFNTADSDQYGIFNLKLPATGIYAGLPLTGVSLGTGNAVQTSFDFPSRNVKQTGITVYVDGAANSNNTVSEVATPGVVTMERPPANYQNADQSVSGDGTKIIYATTNPTLVTRVNGGFETYTFSDSRATNKGVAISEDGLMVVVAIDTSPFAKIYRYTGGAWVAGESLPVCPYSPDLIRISTDQNHILMNGSNAAWVLEYATGSWSQKGTTYAHGATVRTLAISADGLTYVLHCYTVYIRYWTGSAWASKGTSPVTGTLDLTRMYLNSDGSKLASLGDGHKIWNWTGSAWAQESVLPGGGGGYISRDFTKMFCITGTNVTVGKWNGASWDSSTVALVATAGNHMVGDTNCNFVANISQWFDLDLKKTKVVFNSAPANGAVITADYTVNGIHKTTTRVIDLYAEIVFGEVT